MGRDGAAPQDEFCPVHAAIQILQEKWVLHIIRALLEGPRGFNELSRLVGGCNPATLTQRLSGLEELGLLSKTIHSYMPPRTAYALTLAGVSLQGVVEAIARWGTEHLRAEEHGVRVCDAEAPAADPAVSRRPGRG